MLTCVWSISEFSFSDLVCNLCSFDLLLWPLSRNQITNELLCCDLLICQIILIRLVTNTSSNVPNLCRCDLFKSDSNELELDARCKCVWCNLWSWNLIWLGRLWSNRPYIGILIRKYVSSILLECQTDQCVLSACCVYYETASVVSESLCPSCHSWNSVCTGHLRSNMSPLSVNVLDKLQLNLVKVTFIFI